MLFYSIVLLMPFIFRVFFSSIKDEKNKKIYLTCIFMCLFIISSLRGESVGIDTASYRETYCLIRDYGIGAYYRDGESYEYGYLILIWILSRIFHDPQILFVVFSVVTNYAMCKTIYKYSNDPMMASFLYIMWGFASSMNTSRQQFAFAIILLGIPFLEKKNFLKWVLLVLGAATVHKSTLVFLPIAVIPLLRKKSDEFKTMIIVLIGFFGSILLLDHFINLVIYLVPRYYKHFYGQRYGGGTGEASLFWIMLYFLILFMAIRLFYIDIRIRAKASSFIVEERDSTPVVFFMLLTALQCVQPFFVAYVSSLFTRIGVFSRVGLYIMIPYVIKKSCDKYFTNDSRRIIYIVFYLLFGIFAFHIYQQDGYGIIPYSFFWN